ncbi:MAG: DUF968 domain-containing protein [Mesorhizobium sp.]|nr:DUF968 domain-containing protein [Mesorhizobium sp.]MCO5159674.1 DUF968 domain-containing protein [Mesorhizobium sp.]
MAFALRKQGFDNQPTGKKSKRVEMPKYLDFIRSLPCIVTGRTPVEAAHVSYAAPRYGKLGRGKASKESDCWAVPLSPDEHRRSHSMNERAYWQSVGIDPCFVAVCLYASYPNHERAMLVIRNIERRVPVWPAGANREGD